MDYEYIYSPMSRLETSTVVKLGGGTGTLVGRRTVVTCAHAVFENRFVEGGLGLPKLLRGTFDVWVAPAATGAEMPFGDSFTEAVYLDARLLPAILKYWPLPVGGAPDSVRQYDFAVVVLERPLGDYSSWTSVSENFTHMATGHTYGYPDLRGTFWAGVHELLGGTSTDLWAPLAAANMPFMQMYGTEVRLINPTGEWFVLPAELPENAEFVVLDGDIVGGQSGSPVYQEWYGFERIVGVVTHAQGPMLEEVSPSTGKNYGSRINAVRKQLIDDTLTKYDWRPSSYPENYGGWTSLKGRSLRPPTVVATANRIQLFIQGENRHVHRRIWTSAFGWTTPWEDLGGRTSWSPAVMVDSNGITWIAVTSEDGRLTVGPIIGDSWYRTTLAWDAYEMPTIVEGSANVLHVFYLSRSREVMWRKGITEGTHVLWTLPKSLGRRKPGSVASVCSAISAVRLSNDRILLAGTDVDGYFQYKILDPLNPSERWDFDGSRDLFGNPRLVEVGGVVYAVVRTGPPGVAAWAGTAHRFRVPLAGPPLEWAPIGIGEKGLTRPPYALSGNIDAVARGSGLFVIGRRCEKASQSHGRVVARTVYPTSSHSYFSHVDHDLGGTMIDARAVTRGDRVWVFARGYDLQIYCRVV